MEFRDNNRNGIDDRDELRELAHRAMRNRGFLDETPEEVRVAVGQLGETGLAAAAPREVKDLRALPWSSIDNDESKDLDQLEQAEAMGGFTRLRVAIADVASFAPADGSIDRAAAHNTTSVYTAGGVFPMLDRALSEQLTSLLEGEERLAWVTELDVAPGGQVLRSSHYPALVCNHAKLTYPSVGHWLETGENLPEALRRRPDLIAQVQLQDQVAQSLRRARFGHGALGLNTREASVVRDAEGRIVDIATRAQNRAGALIEDLMIAVNEAVARYLEHAGLPSVRRVVRTPERWPRLRELAQEYGQELPPTPSPIALAAFLKTVTAAQPEHAEELSTAVVKLVGRGEYALKLPGQQPPGHFGLAMDDYTHSTAPNRRYPDVITQRLLSAAVAAQGCPFEISALEALAKRCSEREQEAKKVERQIQKSAAALLLSGREGQYFNGVVTGASEKGTWVRIFKPMVEGRLVRGFQGHDVGARVRVRLVECDVTKGFVDFVAAG